MNFKSPSRASCQQLRSLFRVPGTFVSLLLGISLLAPNSPAQSVPLRPAIAKPAKPQPNQAEAELARLISAAEAARTSGDTEAVAQANQKLIALALRELGQLRLLESAYLQAIELYQRSVALEDLPAARVDLAIAQLQANRTDDSLREVDGALAASPKDERALLVRGRALVKKQDYANAAKAFNQAAQLNPDVETFYSLAICLLQSKNPGDKTRARQVFQQMVRRAGESGSLHVLFGRAYRDANDMPRAVLEFQRAVTLDPATPHAHYFLALARMAVNEWKATPEIKAELSKELARDPKDYLANYMLGFIASSERDYASSDRYLQAAVAVNPDWPEPWLYMGLNAYATSDAKRAEEMFRKAITLTGDDESRSNFQIRRAYVDLGRILANSGRAEESEKYLTKARDLQNKTMQEGQQNVSAMALAGGAGNAAAIVPLNRQDEDQAAPVAVGSTDPFARVNAALVGRVLTKDQQAAADVQENHLRSVLGLAFNDLATSEAVRKEYPAALGHYQEAEHWDPTISGLAKNLGQAAFRLNNYPEAIRALSLAIAEQPANNPVRAMLGMSYFGSEQYAEVVKTVSALGTSGMQDSSVGYAWAASLFHLGDLKTASTVLDEFAKANRSTGALLLAGQLWIDIGDYTRAVDTLHAALLSDPTLRKAHYYAGQADIRQEHWPEAANEFQAELTLEPNDGDAKYNLGFVRLQQSKTDDAAEIFQDVLRTHPDHANAHYELGKILQDRGQLTEAVDHLETAVRLSPQTDYMHYQLQAAYRKQSRIEDADRELAIFKEMKAKQRERLTPQAPASR